MSSILEYIKKIYEGVANRLRLFLSFVLQQVKLVKNFGNSVKSLWNPIKDVIKQKHRFVVMDVNTYKEKFSFQLSGINLFVTLGISIILLVTLTSLLIAFTPLREFIPGYANGEMIEQTYANAHVIDSLETEISNQEQMISIIQAVLMGHEIPGEEEYAKTAAQSKPDSVVYVRSKADSLLRLEVEREDSKYQVKGNALAKNADKNSLNAKVQSAQQLFFAPLKGPVTSQFDAKIRHYGVDIAGEVNAVIKAVYGGTVIFSNFTVETGYVIAIQHSGNIISVYKHNSSLLKRQGDVVRVGEPIAYIGDSGKYSSGPHLHFELWISGKPVDPQQYIVF